MLLLWAVSIFAVGFGSEQNPSRSSEVPGQTPEVELVDSQSAPSAEKGTGEKTSDEDAKVLELVVREFADFEHRFTKEELGTDAALIPDGLPAGATFDDATRTLKWCPADGAESFDLTWMRSDGKGEPATLPRIRLTVEKAYHPAIHLTPSVLPLKNKSRTQEQALVACRFLLKFPVPAKPMLRRFDILDAQVRKSQASIGEDARFEVARALVILQAGGLTVADNQTVVASLSKAISQSGSRYLPAFYLKLWMLIRMNQVHEVTKLIPVYSKALQVPDVASRDELLLRLYELGSLVEFLQEKTRDSHHPEFSKSRDELLQAFADDAECTRVLQDGMNRMRVHLREEKLALEEKREDRVKQGEKKLQDTLGRQSQLSGDLEKAQSEYKNIEQKWRDEVSPLDEELAPLNQKRQLLNDQYRDLRGDVDVVSANIQINGVDQNGNLVNPAGNTYLQQQHARLMELKKKIEAKKVELDQLDRELSPLAKKREMVNQKWSRSHLTARKNLEKARREFDRSSRQVTASKGKSVAPLHFDPSLPDLIPIDIDFQQRYLLESFGVSLAK